jgi:hypothetical protein
VHFVLHENNINVNKTHLLIPRIGTAIFGASLDNLSKLSKMKPNCENFIVKDD